MEKRAVLLRETRGGSPPCRPIRVRPVVAALAQAHKVGIDKRELRRVLDLYDVVNKRGLHRQPVPIVPTVPSAPDAEISVALEDRGALLLPDV